LTLERTLELTVAHHPRLREATWRLRAASQRRRDAGRMPNPGLWLDVENVGGDVPSEAREVTAGLVQALQLGGDRGASARLAEATERLAWAELSLEEREVLTEASERFLETWTLQERAGRLAAAERLAQRSIAAAAERFRAGAGPELEQARAEGVAALRRSEWLRTNADLTASWQRLVASWGSTEVRFDSLALTAPESERIPPPAQLYALLDEHPQRARATAAVSLEEARLRQVRAARVPDLDLKAGVRQFGADATTFVVGASIPLPIWNRQTGEGAAAQAESEAAKARADLATLELRAALRQAYERYIAAQESHELIATRVNPKSEEVLRQLTSGYRGGRYSSLEYLEGQRSLLEAQLQLIDATAEAWRARQTLERLLGRSIEDLTTETER
jgi:cobalt-zinc-cadmium efflux system outer membrane protein